MKGKDFCLKSRVNIMNKDKLIKYLESVLILEKQCYIFKSIKNVLNNSNNNLRYYSYFSNKKQNIPFPEKPKEPILERKFELFRRSLCYSIIALIIIYIIVFLMCLHQMSSVDKEVFLYPLFFGVPAFVITFIFVIDTNRREKELYNTKLTNYRVDCENINKQNEQINEENKHIEEENQRFKIANQEIQRKKEYIQGQIDELDKAYNETKSTLTRYYNLDIIYSKYRTMTVVAQFLEYLYSGRCDTLTGANGAYNKLEDDIKFGIITTQLNTIINKLDVIIHNQELICNVLSECDEKTENFCNNVVSALNNITNSADSINTKFDNLNYIELANLTNTKILKDIEIYKSLK